MKIRRLAIRTLCLLGLWLGVGLQAQAQTDTVTYVYTDPQGTPLVKADASGNVIAKYDYTPYGNSIASLGAAPNGPGYTGHVNDPETGLVYMQARYYQPTGRFLSPDPVEPVVGNLFNFNRYDYTSNNPINHIDPNGMLPDEINQSQDWQNKMFGYDSRCSVCAQASSGTAKVTNLSPVNVSGDASSGQPMGQGGKATDAVFSTLFGVAFNEMKRPNHPTKIPDSLAHELFVVNATGVGLAASPSAVAIGVSSVPVVADGGVVAAGAVGNVTLRYGPRVAILTCLGGACAGQEKPDQFVKDREVLQEIYEGAKAAGSEIYKQVFTGSKN